MKVDDIWQNPHEERPILDHGYVKFIDSWGSDAAIIEAARMSTNKGFLGWGPKTDGSAGDEKLLRYLYENNHHSPFEMAGMTIEVQAPIFVFREWHRHRTQSYNEMSGRYTQLPNLHYVPTLYRLMLNSNNGNKQAGTIKDSTPLTIEEAEIFRQELFKQYARAEALYNKALYAGIPKELARIHLPVARYSRMRASANLRNWLGFLTLRMDRDAQWEIRQYANAVGDLIKYYFPRTWELFTE